MTKKKCFHNESLVLASQFQHGILSTVQENTAYLSRCKYVFWCRVLFTCATDPGYAIILGLADCQVHAESADDLPLQSENHPLVSNMKHSHSTTRQDKTKKWLRIFLPGCDPTPFTKQPKWTAKQQHTSTYRADTIASIHKSCARSFLDDDGSGFAIAKASGNLSHIHFYSKQNTLSAFYDKIQPAEDKQWRVSLESWSCLILKTVSFRLTSQRTNKFLC